MPFPLSPSHSALMSFAQRRDRHAGRIHSLILKKDGTLWASGANGYGQLGTGDNRDRFGFEMVLSKVKAVAGGNRFTLAVRNDGVLWAVGGNGSCEFPKYGIFDNKRRTKFVRVLRDVESIAATWGYRSDESFSLAVKKDGTVWGYGGDGWGVFGDKKNLTAYEEWTQLYH